MYTTIPAHSILAATSNTSDFTFNHVSGFTGMVVLNVVGAVLNLFAASYIAFTRKLRKRKSNKLLWNLLSSNMCVVVVHLSCILLYFTKDINQCEDIFFAQPVSEISISVTMSLSLFNLTSLTLDRLLAVKLPFFLPGINQNIACLHYHLRSLDIVVDLFVSSSYYVACQWNFCDVRYY